MMKNLQKHYQAKMQSPQSLWVDRICLITGAFGFVGTHLCQELISRGAIVVALDWLPNTAGTYFGLAGLERNTIVLHGDIRKANELLGLQRFKFDVVFHLAAQPISPLSNIRPDETMSINANGTACLGEVLSLQQPPPIFVFASSACWYGATTISPLKEGDPYVEGEFKYSESKVLAEKEVLKFESLYDIPTIRCRFVNLYGPGDRHFSRIIPKTIRHLIRGEEPTLVRNDGTTVLDFMRVEEAVSALMISAEHGSAIRGEVFNFGVAGNNPRSALEVVKLVSMLFDGIARTPVLLNALLPKTKKKFLDNSKAIRQLGWKPSKSLEEGLSTTIKWYVESIDKIEALEF